MEKNIAIFNSFHCHYEMFGYIIYYCFINKYKLTIYTQENYDMKWFSFYKNLFSRFNYHFNIIHYTKFEEGIQHNNYDLIFLTTDDDRNFNSKWVSNKVICINHYFKHRRFDCKHYIGTRPFRDSSLEWAIPCFPVVDYSEKRCNHDTCMHVAMIGTGYSYNPYNINVINRLASNKKIILHIITRKISCDISEIDSRIEVCKHESINTDEMFSILLSCSYILTDIHFKLTDHQEGYSMSGSIPLAFSTLTKLIISKKNNSFYNFKNVIEFEINSDEKIQLPDITEQVLKSQMEERGYLIYMFHTQLNKIMDINTLHDRQLKNTALIIEPRFFDVIIPYVIEEYDKILGDSWQIIFYCGKGLKTTWENIIKTKNVEIRELEVTNFDTPRQHSYYFKQRELWESLYGEYVLTFQTDSIIKNIEPYTLENYMKLNKSYIGGNMSYGWNELIRENIYPPFKNFNGGLSLRKRLDMIKIIDTFGVEYSEKPTNNMKTDAEDVYFTLGCYKLNLPVGDDEFCSHFAIHTIYHDKFFGVHNSQFLNKDLLLKDHSDLDFFVKNFK